MKTSQSLCLQQVLFQSALFIFALLHQVSLFFISFISAFELSLQHNYFIILAYPLDILRSEELMIQTKQSSKNYLENVCVEDKIDEIQYIYENVRKNQKNYISNQRYIDEQMILCAKKQQGYIVKRLSDVYKLQTSIFTDQQGKYITKPTKNQINKASPTYLSELNMLPFEHFAKLIEPHFINDEGLFFVTVVKDGIINKVILDDKFYFHEEQGHLWSHTQLGQSIWAHILVKAWAKINKGYDNLEKCKPFQFIRTFSFPDWQTINPQKQRKENILSKFSKCNKKYEIIIGRTKENMDVNRFGFVADSASFQITGSYQQYGDIYVKIKSYTESCWNMLKSNSHQKQAEGQPKLSQNQFMMPYQEFTNVFHLIYSTTNKYTKGSIQNSKVVCPHRNEDLQLTRRSSISSNAGHPSKIDTVHYNKYILNNDARQTNAIVLCMEVEQNKSIESHTQRYLPIGFSIYFPTIKVYDLVRNQHKTKQPNTEVVPYCKLMIGQVLDSAHHDANYVESVKQKMLYSQQNTLNFVTHAGNHQYIAASYFKGYAKQLTHILYLKPGKYFLRLKVEQKVSEYRCFINTTTINGSTKIYDPKINQKEQVTFLKDCLFKKAARDKKFITFVNPAKRGSWISCRDEYQLVGYSYVAVHVVMNAIHKILINVSPKKLKQNGYLIKGHKHTNKNDYSVMVDSDENTLFVIKYDKQWKGKSRIWPPPGIQFIKIPRNSTALQ